MNLSEFKDSLNDKQPPLHASVYVQALWFDGRGEWEQAHKLIQDLHEREAAWIHAYLHRKEGDTWNADYWYTQAQKKKPAVSFDEEWEAIAAALL